MRFRNQIFRNGNAAVSKAVILSHILILSHIFKWQNDLKANWDTKIDINFIVFNLFSLYFWLADVIVDEKSWNQFYRPKKKYFNFLLNTVPQYLFSKWNSMIFCKNYDSTFLFH